MQIVTAVEGIGHACPGDSPPLFDFEEFLAITAVVEIDARESASNSNGFGASGSIGAGVAGSPSCHFIDTVVVTVNVVAVACAGDGDSKTRGVTSARVVGFDDHNEGV